MKHFCHLGEASVSFSPVGAVLKQNRRGRCFITVVEEQHNKNIPHEQKKKKKKKKSTFSAILFNGSH